jgi:hypothetical protein
MSINRANATPTAGSSVLWTVKFTESVTGVDTTDFTLVKTGLGGSPTVTGVSGSGDTYTVTGSTGSGSGTLGLNLVDNDSIKDLAGNALGGAGNGNGNFTGQVYTVDRTPPATPVLTVFPPDPSTDASSHFEWTDATPADVHHYECSKESGSFQPCSTPLTYAAETTNNGQHQFDVRAVDAVGNVSGSASYKWKVDKGSLQEFTMSGSVAPGNLLYPGGVARPIPVTFHNPNSVAIYVTALTVGINASSLPALCQASWFQITQSNVSSVNTVTVPAGGSTTLPAGGVTAPTIKMTDSGNQDACEGATFQLTYSGSAHS